MKRLPIILSGLLALQLAGAVALAFISPDYGAYKANEPLITVDANAVKELVIDASEGESVTLRRQKNAWILPGLHDFPADGTKVASLIERLGKLKRGLPVAVTSSAPKRFKVTEDSHERRIVLRGGGDTLAEIFFGTSPSYRQVHVRTPDEDSVYSVSFATYDAGTRPADWMARDFLRLPEKDIVRVELPSLVLVRNDKGIVVEGLGEKEEMVESKARNILRTLARPGFTAVEGKGEAALARIGEPDLTATLKLKDDTSFTYRLKRTKDKDDYLLASSRHDYLFRIPKYAVQAIIDASREKLVRPKSKDADDGDAKSGEAATDDKAPG